MKMIEDRTQHRYSRAKRDMLILNDPPMDFDDFVISGTLTMLGKGAPNLVSGVPRSWFLSASRGN